MRVCGTERGVCGTSGTKVVATVVIEVKNWLKSDQF